MHRRRHGHGDDHRAHLTAGVDAGDGRSARLVGSLDLGALTGLELGPLTNPVVARARGDIRYLDHVDTDALRARYATHKGFDVEAIVDIDYASDGRSIAETVGADAPFDYVVASHVIEHVPDLIAWLADLRAVLRDDGVVALAVPDQRRCFDALRQPTVLADVVDAHLSGATAPTARQVFDHYFSAVQWGGRIVWDVAAPIGELAPVHPESEAMERASDADAGGDYDDVHCWVFTPRSFVRLMAGLRRLGLTPFDVVDCSDTVGIEFFAHLRPVGVAPPVDAPEGPERSSEGGVVCADLEVARARLAAAEAEVAAMRSSRSWRVTRPLRAFNEWRAAGR